MQRDDHLPLGKIYGNKRTLLKSIDKIARLALVKATDDEPLQLRFLTPIQPIGHSTPNGYVDLELTSAKEHTKGLVYTTVSYCWSHAQTESEEMQVPEYRIWDASGPCKAPRQIRCPKIVLHRALRFARGQGCQYLWIDQECIDQDDLADIERHLQIMHRIYRESRWTVVTLSRTITANDIWTAPVSWRETLIDRDSHTYNSAGEEFAQSLDYISTDRWFTRTWTLQEKQCASILKFLIPIDTEVHKPEIVQPLVVGNDLCMDAEHLSWAAKVGKIDNFKRQLNLIDMPGFKGSGQPSSAELPSIGHFINAMNSCDNLVIADRISILANACNFRYRLLSNRLDRSDISYVMCLMVLILVNLIGDIKEVKERIATTWDDISSYNMLANPALILTTLFRIKKLSGDKESDGELWRVLKMESRSAENQQYSSRWIRSAYSNIVFNSCGLEIYAQERLLEQHAEDHLSLNAQRGKQSCDVPRGRRQHALYRLYRRLAQLFRTSPKNRGSAAIPA
jgi:hypothetical protein